MENLPDDTRTGEEILTPWDRKRIFDEIYQGNPSFDVDNEFFTKNSRTLSLEKNIYGRYSSKLEKVECKEAQDKFMLARNKFMLAQDKFFLKAGQNVAKSNPKILIEICEGIGPLLYDFVEERITDEQKVELTQKIQGLLFYNPKLLKTLLNKLGLVEIEDFSVLIPLKDNNEAYAPFAVNEFIHKESAVNNRNFIFPYPFELLNHFPVLFCHPMFGDFLDIVHGRNESNPVVIEYEEFVRNGSKFIRNQMDSSIFSLIRTILETKEDQNENNFVENFALALRKIFTDPSCVRTKFKVEVETAAVPASAASSNRVSTSVNYTMDSAILINEFPFITIEAKNNAYSMRAVLQGLQYYGLVGESLIDNDPGFLITFDHGILYLYGIAKVNRRVVCSCLLSFEFTNCLFNMEGFSDTLYRCFYALYFFYNKLKQRIPQKSSDPQHKKYSSIKSAKSLNAQPYPAIFSVKNESDPSQRIGIKFENFKDQDSKIQPYLKPCVYLVKMEDDSYGVLKIACNYDIEMHRILASEELKLAPRIFGYEKLWSRYHIILMEVYDVSSYKSIYQHLRSSNLNCQNLYGSLKAILGQLRGLELVHGDFRSTNILARRSQSDPSILEDFKLIDFEFSGKVNEPYPFLALKNYKITWPEDFNSYMPRVFKHDEFMLDQMKNNEFNIENL